MDAIAAVASVAGQHGRVGPFRCSAARVVRHFHAPDHAAALATDVGDEGQLLKTEQAGLDDGGSPTTRPEDVSGGEFNCTANLADCFGMRTAIATAMVEYPIGELIAGQVRAMGVTPFYKKFKHDGVRGPNMAAVYSDRGFGVRGPVVFYNRSNEAAALLKPGDFDWTAIFAGGVRWFHSGGIFAALSSTTSELIIEAMKVAKAHGAVASFDLNYRESLWQANGGKARADEVCRDLAPHIDVMLGRTDVESVAIAFPQLKVAATGVRTVKNASSAARR